MRSMRTIKVKLFQSLFDISVQEYGTAEGITTIALANDIGITDELQAGTELKIPDYENTNQKVLKYYKENNIIPATAQLPDEIEAIVADETIDGNQSPPIIAYDPTFSEEF